MKRLFVLLTLLAGINVSAQHRHQAIDSLLATYETPHAPGLSVMVIKNQEPVYRKNIGLADIKRSVIISDSTSFSIASVAKQFTAACIWSLVKQKKIRLDDDVRTYLPEMPDYGKPVKIRHLLNHTAGIRNYHTLMYLSGFDYDTEYYNNTTVLTLASRQKSLANVPGDKVLYSNTHYNLLATIIERVSGQTLADYAKANIFLALGMHSTIIPVNNNIVIANRAVGYLPVGENYKPFTRVQESYGAGSMYTTMIDMARWSAVLHGKNKKFTALTKFLTTTEILPSGKTANYARGIMADDYKDYKTFHHSGFGDGFQSQIIAVPELGLTVILFTNLQTINPSPLSYKIVDLYLPEPKINPVPGVGPAKTKAADLRLFSGQYREINSDMKMELLIDNDTLKAKGQQGNLVPLKQIATNTFCRINNESVKYEFSLSRSGTHDMTIYFGGAPFYFKRAQFVNPENVNANEYVGSYYSKELDCTYLFSADQNKLFLTRKNHDKSLITPIQQDEFGNGDRTLYTFERKNGKVTTLLLAADGTVSNIQFQKIQP